MKPLRLTIVALLLSASSVLAAPTLSVQQAAELAQQHLRERGLAGSRYITSLALEKEAGKRGEHYWYARWSEGVRIEQKQTELGLRINMDGSLVHVVEGPAAPPKHYRTRSNRPSILDLKH